MSGRDGSDGSSGRGGSIIVMVDPQASHLISALHLSNQGGPKPIFRQEAVAPLW
jgi:hypothetical protein